MKRKLIEFKDGWSDPPGSRRERRREWVSAIGHLYDKIEKMLAPLIAEKLVDLAREPIERYEDKYGAYKTERLILSLSNGKAKIVFEPVARDGLGHTGRIDVFRYGFYTEGVWLLRDDGDTWRFFDRMPKSRGRRLARNTLESTIERLIGG